MATESKVAALGYIGVTAPDLDEWRSFATNVLGAAIAPASNDERLLLRIDERAWRICVVPSAVAPQPGAGGVAFCGWEVASPTQLERIAADLDAAGITYSEDSGLAIERGVNGLLVCKDPSDIQVEFFCGADVSRHPFSSPTGARFVTSNKSDGDLGLGHAMFWFEDQDEAKHFYMDILGFRLSDTMAFGPDRTRAATFAHVNPRHHSIVIAGKGGPPGTLNHLMLEVEDLDTVGFALDRATAAGVEIVAKLGKHTNDHMTSIYVRTPSGFDIEYGFNGRLIDASTWTTTHYDTDSFWGHQRASRP